MAPHTPARRERERARAAVLDGERLPQRRPRRCVAAGRDGLGEESAALLLRQRSREPLRVVVVVADGAEHAHGDGARLVAVGERVELGQRRFHVGFRPADEEQPHHGVVGAKPAGEPHGVGGIRLGVPQEQRGEPQRAVRRRRLGRHRERLRLERGGVRGVGRFVVRCGRRDDRRRAVGRLCGARLGAVGRGAERGEMQRGGAERGARDEQQDRAHHGRPPFVGARRPGAGLCFV
ncbi:MAG TPA: hypothetical protein VIN61_18685 [Gammaproteobacteria bacterium]